MTIDEAKKVTMKVSPDTYKRLQLIRIQNTKCKFNDDTISMLITAYNRTKGSR